MIDKLIWELIKKRLNVPCFECEVISVDKTNDTCRLKPTEEDRAELLNVRLTATIETKQTKVVIYPLVGSTVVVILLNDMVTQALIVAFSEVEEIKIDCDKVVFNNGLLGGLVNINNLKEQWDSNFRGVGTAISTALDAIDTQLMALGQVGGSYEVFDTTFNTVVFNLDKATLEDTKIKH